MVNMQIGGTMMLLLLAYTGADLNVPCTMIRNPSLNESLNTQRIQDALDMASIVGGCVSVGGGDYPILTVLVKDDTTLRLEPDTRLMAVINVTKDVMIHVLNAKNVTIEGGGTIYGNAEHAWAYYSDKDNRFSPYGDDGTSARVNTLRIANSDKITVKDINLHNSTDWTFRMDNSSNIFVDNVDIYGDERFPNNDGFDPQSCVNVTLINSRISVADDGICPKADATMGPLLNLYVHNVTIRSHSHAIKFGSNTDSLMANIVFDNVTIWDSNGGMSIQQRSQGNIENVTWSNMIVETRYSAPRWWGNGEWLGVTNTPRDDGKAIGYIKGLRFINITAKSENGGILSGLSGGVSDVTFENVKV